MFSGHDQHLREIVKASDVAVRTASQLRLLKVGRTLGDRRAIELAIQFLSRARDGGTFITKQSSSLHRSLKPFNWATDTYIELFQPSSTNFEEVAQYLDRIISGLNAALVQQSASDPEVFDFVAAFFSKLGEILGARADGILLAASEAPSRRL